MTKIVPSGAMLAQGLKLMPFASPAGTAASDLLPPSTAIAKVKPAAPIMTWRRETTALNRSIICIVMAHASRAARSIARRMRG
jgi:hypothetical protein